MGDLTMTGAKFFKMIVLPFFGGWFMASMTIRLLIVGLLRSTGKKSNLIFCLMLLCMTVCLLCFGIINYLVVMRLHILDLISDKQSENFLLNGLPSALVALFFMTRSYKKITEP